MSDYIDEDDDCSDYKDDFWGRTPQSSYFEIVKTANKNIAEDESEKIFIGLAVVEKVFEEHGIKQEISRTVIAGRTGSVSIDLVGQIVTKCE